MSASDGNCGNRVDEAARLPHAAMEIRGAAHARLQPHLAFELSCERDRPGRVAAPSSPRSAIHHTAMSATAADEATAAAFALAKKGDLQAVITGNSVSNQELCAFVVQYAATPVHHLQQVMMMMMMMLLPITDTDGHARIMPSS